MSQLQCFTADVLQNSCFSAYFQREKRQRPTQSSYNLSSAFRFALDRRKLVGGYFEPPAGRHVPGSQAPFSLIPDLDQNKEDGFFFVSYGVYIPLSRPIQFCPSPNQNFEKNAQDPGDPEERWI